MCSSWYPSPRRLPSGTPPSPRVWRLGEVESCLDSARRLADAGRLQPWDSVQVVAQRQGRGQLRRRWFSPPGNLYAALRLPLETPFNAPEGSVVCGTLLAMALCSLGWETRLKWPNDIVVTAGEDVRKLAGLLLEERGDCLLAGIGINILSCPGEEEMRRDAAMPATCLARLIPEGGAAPTAESLWRRLVNRLFSAYSQERFFAARWREEAERLLLWRHCNVIVDDGREQMRGRLAGLAQDGGLCLIRDGRERILRGGSLRLDEARCAQQPGKNGQGRVSPANETTK